MKQPHKVKLAPFLIAGTVLLLVCLLEVLPPLFSKRLDIFERLELITYDWRVRAASQNSPVVATNLGAAFIDDAGLQKVNENLGYDYPWPRKLYGTLVQELTDRGAEVIGFDILFSELHPADPATDYKLPSGRSIPSDQVFAIGLRRNKNVILAAMGETLEGQWHALMPAEFFRTNALGVGHITSDHDADGVLRRAVPFRMDPAQGRIWHMGILLAAQHLKLDLEKAVIEPQRIILRGENGLERIIPLDADGTFYINWSLTWNDKRLLQAPVHEFLGMSSNAPPPDWQGRIVVVGSIGAGNNISDMGATPLEKSTYLVSKHWNVANSILTGQFVQRAGSGVTLLLIFLMGIVSAVVSWRGRAPWASIIVVAVAALYMVVTFMVFTSTRYWLPIVLPVGGGLGLMHVMIAVYQVVFEQREKRHVKSVFSRLVSPNVVHELLSAEQLNLGGSRRRITVLFADVRGFTQMTDVNQQNAENYVRDHGLTGDVAEAYFDESARETLATVNVYLATIADQIKAHDGTLDKYIGDCVMAFWGAPTPNEKHASACVRAAVDAQRAMYRLNQTRAEMNKQREEENMLRIASGQPPLPPLSLLSLGTGINSGICIVGLMGSQHHILNYTVFGREVNLASRLEGVSGRGRVIIGEATYVDLVKHDPELAATCVALDPVQVKGIAQAVAIYEVPWKQGLDSAGTSMEKKDSPDVTGFMRMGEAKPGAGTMMITKPDAAGKPAESPKGSKAPEGKS